MNCNEVEAVLPEGALDEQVRAHLAECSACAQTAAVLAMATQAPLSAAERAKLVSLPVSVQAEWARLSRRRSAAQKFIGLAVAASLGAVVASGLMWQLASRPNLVEPQVLVWMDDATPSLSDEDLDVEVSWPTLTEEGDVQ